MLKWFMSIRGVISVGVALLFGGFAWGVVFAGIPYQDPTPQMQATYDMHMSISDGASVGGALLILAGIVAATFRGVRSLLKPRSPKT